MNTTQFHTPSFGDEVFEINDVGGNSTTIGSGNATTNNGTAGASYMYQTTPQQQLTAQTKRMINLHNTSDEYHTANEESFTSNSMSFGGSPSLGISAGQQQSGTNQTTTSTPTTLAARKQMSPVDPNEPAKPLSAYALFFRDTVSAIKQQNPMCSFQELSKIVASMWEALDPVHKSVYNKKNEVAKNDYIKQMRIYRQQQTQNNVNGGKGGMQTTAAAAASPVSNLTGIQSKPAVFTMNLNQQQQPQPTSAQVPPGNQPQQFVQNPLQSNVSNANSNAATSNPLSPANANNSTSSAAPSDDQIQLLTEAGSVQKCTRENCTKRAIINPDWEDEYCSNECVVIHCRNVFNAWVQSNLEAKQQQQPQSDLQQQQTQATTT